MSFIRIIKEKNPIEMHNQVYEASKNNKLTPEFCMDILSHTNVSVIMIRMLEEIEKRPIEEQKHYKEVILSMFDRRQTNKNVKNKALEIAENLGFESELNEVIESTGGGGYPARVGCDKIGVLLKEDAWKSSRILNFSIRSFVDYDYTIVGENIDEPVVYGSNSKLKGVVNLCGLKDVSMRFSNLSNVKKMIFGKDALVNFNSIKKSPKEAEFLDCDKVEFYNVKELPKKLIFLTCRDINFKGCDFDNVESISFKEGGRVSFEYAKKLPSWLDVSKCDYISICSSDLSNLEKLDFREGSEVHLEGITSLPEKLDFSKCKKVTMIMSDISNVKELRFKNKEQMMESKVDIYDGWKGKIIYTDDEKNKILEITSKINECRF